MGPTKAFFVYFGAALAFQISLLVAGGVLAGVFNLEVVIVWVMCLYAPIFFLIQSSGVLTPAQGIGVALFGMPLGMAFYSAVASVIICRFKFRRVNAT